MRHILTALLLMAMATPGTARQTQPSAQRAIEQAMTASAAGWNAGDVERFMAVYLARPETSFVVKDGLIRGKPASGPTTLVFAREHGAWHIIADHSS